MLPPRSVCRENSQGLTVGVGLTVGLCRYALSLAEDASLPASNPIYLALVLNYAVSAPVCCECTGELRVLRVHWLDGELRVLVPSPFSTTCRTT